METTETETTTERIARLDKAIRQAKAELPALEVMIQKKRGSLETLTDAAQWAKTRDEIGAIEAEQATSRNRLALLETELTQAQRDLTLERLQQERQDLIKLALEYKRLDELAGEAFRIYRPLLEKMFDLAENYNYLIKRYGDQRDRAGLKPGDGDFETPHIGAPDWQYPPPYEKLAPGLACFQRNWELRPHSSKKASSEPPEQPRLEES